MFFTKESERKNLQIPIIQRETDITFKMISRLLINFLLEAYVKIQIIIADNASVISEYIMTPFKNLFTYSILTNCDKKINNLNLKYY